MNFFLLHLTQNKTNKQTSHTEAGEPYQAECQPAVPYSPTRKSSTPLFAKFEKRLKLFLTVPRPSRPVFSQPPNMVKWAIPSMGALTNTTPSFTQ